ncbi:MAG: hypothetical protein AAF492_03415 [Verrucomicrobiota bacterium]
MNKENMETTTVTVSSQACIYFAWADSSATGPYGEDVGACKPVIVDVEPDDEITISASPSDEWSNGSEEYMWANADGRDEPLGTNNAYSSPNYNSENINPNTARVCKLVGVFEENGAQPVSMIDVINIGLSNVLIAPASATKLFLGFHDGFEWSNNEDSIQVTVDISRGGS